MITEAQVKQCRDCGEIKPLTEYSRYSKLKTFKPMCKACCRILDAQYKKKQRDNSPEHRQRQLEINKAYRERYSDGYKRHRLKKREAHRSSYFTDLRYRCKQIASATRARAARKDFACEVTEDVLYVLIHAQNFKCAVTGTPFDLRESSKYHRQPCAPSIDRKDSDFGYTLDNIQIVAAWYNIMKNEWTDEDVKGYIHTAYHNLFPNGG